MFDRAEYAVHEEADSCQREYAESEHPQRTPFQRDRDRIVHSKAFRRLEYKTQVFVNHLGDSFRTRLTHSIEVSQIARSAARILRLNEDLVETIALAHDLGHPPFGHAGERALNQLMRPYGGFDHNQQTIKVVTLLEERYPQFPGLNLTKAARWGLQKHNKLPMGQSHSLEAQLVDICDEIAYNNHDLDDGLESGLLTLDQLQNVELWRDSWEDTQKKFPDVSDKIKIRYSIRSLIDQMVMNLTSQTEKNIVHFELKTFENVMKFHHKYDPKVKIVYFSEEFSRKFIQLKQFLVKNLYKHQRIEKMNKEAKEVIKKIFFSLTQRTELLPKEYQKRIPHTSIYENISDFIAGMTDRYAIGWK